MTTFTVSENRFTGKRVQYRDGKIIVTTMRKPMPETERKMVATARFEPEILLEKLETAIRAGKADSKQLLAILDAKPDFDALTGEGDSA